MRYKFRGKNVENGRWVYGDLIQRDDRTHITELEDTYGYYQMVYVNSETIGQYTGLKDCNEKKIYEGDILSTISLKVHKEVYWDEGEARYRLRNLNLGNYVDGGDLTEGYINTTGMVIIGNKYDNPELMKGDSDERD